MMGYLNPLLRLPAARNLLHLPLEQRKAMALVLRQLRDQANTEAEQAWRRRKGPMAAYWRAVSTYARHLAHALEQTATDAAIAKEP
ncbi:hypothetical protein ACKI2N_012525 [Cupriavidus sp. 30B13]|uniref:hypothetical protein n=1 Tax=Cupriavidus sp. 30B13 TaxID=3384241 RepID=UPI003B91B7F1